MLYDWDGLFDKLRDIGCPDGVDRINRLNIDKEEQEEVDVKDDCARELSFLMQALDAVRQDYLNFQSKGEPFLRPDNYYGEIVKPDSHMVKVKANSWPSDLDLAFDKDGTKPLSKKRRGVSPRDRSRGKATFGGKRKGPNKKRKSRDSKFGLGGRKGLKKQNTAETTNYSRGFHKGEFLANKKRTK
ncbi:hypothetical protein RND71_041445 [Anisodus tanguticus]|uniref:Uncharacterized protein n=1 Tax=Anisodus tanguticus TaxID=243964 RepID=A0AAE1UPT9_9SOLA|nr:hypothetical protein RND71_041445 [Anisodus tanguticus]